MVSGLSVAATKKIFAGASFDSGPENGSMT
jgi:hypothetical protein